MFDVIYGVWIIPKLVAFVDIDGAPFTNVDSSQWYDRALFTFKQLSTYFL